MRTILFFLGIILGIMCGIGLPLLILSSKLNKSNNFGDSKGELTHFADSRGFVVLMRKDRVSKNTPIYSGISEIANQNSRTFLQPPQPQP